MSGSLSPQVLWRIFELHCQIGAKTSAETGCGLTTLVLSQLSERHLSFTVDFGDSLPNTRSHPLFRSETTTFIVNPTQVSLPGWKFAEPLDFVILDGPHAYPFPDLEYFHFYPQIREGGVLVIDDIHIPTIGHLHDFLRDDEMWEHLGDVDTTGFFQRTHVEMLSPHGDGWPQQRYNRRRFAYPDALNGMFGEGWYEADFGPRTPNSSAPKHVSGAELEQVEAKLALCEAELSAARSALEREQARAKRSEQVVDALRNSSSWRVTAPLRAIKRVFSAS